MSGIVSSIDSRSGIIGGHPTAFYAYDGSGSTAVADNDPIPFTSTLYNDGNLFITGSTARFPVPIAGYYTFAVQIYLNSGAGLYIVQLAGSSSGTILSISNPDGVSNQTLSASTTYKCSAGETIQLLNKSGGSRNFWIENPGAHTWFSGCFIGGG